MAFDMEDFAFFGCLDEGMKALQSCSSCRIQRLFLTARELEGNMKVMPKKIHPGLCKDGWEVGKRLGFEYIGCFKEKYTTINGRGSLHSFQGDYLQQCYTECRNLNTKYFGIYWSAGWIRCQCSDSENRGDPVPDNQCVNSQSGARFYGTGHSSDKMVLYKIATLTLEECSAYCHGVTGADFMAHSESE